MVDGASAVAPASADRARPRSGARGALTVALISTYELGHQPFGIASPAAWLGEAGARVLCNDVAVDPLDEAAVREADLIALYVPMHTATRLACALLPKIRDLNPSAHVCFYGLYAPVNEAYLRSLGADTILGGEFETGLRDLYHRLCGSAESPLPVTALDKQRFQVPERGALPALDHYAYVEMDDGERRVTGYTEASRGCKHLCRHCPVVPVYNGRFRIVQRDIVRDDIRRQVAMGARHITFGDPDFFNGVGHALKIVEALHAEFPALTYDVTIKVEHLLAQARHLATLRETGCLFVTTAVESVDDTILEILDKGHSRADFLAAVALAQEAGLTLSPTFLPFTPWTTREGYLDLLRTIAGLDLIDHVGPVQLAIRLLVPNGSRLLERPEMQAALGPFDAASLSYRWSYADPRTESLEHEARRIVEEGECQKLSRHAVFEHLWKAAHESLDMVAPPLPEGSERSLPRLSEAWYCCAEPTHDQFANL